jgi:hypothetical protein
MNCDDDYDFMSTNPKGKNVWGIPSLKIDFTGRMTS